MPPRKIHFPLLLVNLKTYEESTGDKAVKLASIGEKVSDETGICVSVSPQTVDLRKVVENTDIPVFAQHIDPVGYGKYTGHTMPKAIAKAGCSGTIINHSERKLPIDVIEATVKRAREAGLYQAVCVDTVETGRTVAHFDPDIIAIEPPELIGSGIPVSKARPEVVSGAVEKVHRVNPEIKVLCGAGITSGQDVAAALSLGADGVLVASGVVKAASPHEKLMELAEAMLL